MGTLIWSKIFSIFIPMKKNFNIMARAAETSKVGLIGIFAGLFCVVFAVIYTIVYHVNKRE